jgi:hypothetical protein
MLTALLLPLGLVNLHLARHGPDAPPTYNRGSAPIDAVFVSPSLLDCQSGYLGFGDAVASNHCCLWLDIPLAVAFGHELQPIPLPKARRLQCRDPRIVAKYNKDFSAFLLQHSLPQQAFSLQSHCHFPLDPSQALEWERLDALRLQGMRFAEKHCRKLRKGNVPWSPAIQQALNLITPWNLVCCCRRGVKVSSSLLRRAAATAGIPEATSATLPVAKASLRLAFQEYKGLIKSASALRTTFLEDLASALSSAGKTSQATQLAVLQRRESQRNMARQIRHMNGKLRTGGITSVLAPTLDGSWVEHTDPVLIEKACLEENERRFRQASNTPFLVPPLDSCVGPLGFGPDSLSILQGTFQPPLAPTHMQLGL